MKRNTNLNGFAISEEMFEWLQKNLPKGKTILEFGSGKGTIELTKHWKVYSIEENADWLDVAKDSTYIYAPIKHYASFFDGCSQIKKAWTWFDVAPIKKAMPKSYDIILIDAPTGRGRLGVLEFWDMFNWDVPIILDDTHREWENKLANLILKKRGGVMTKIDGWEKSFTIIQ